MSTVFHSCIQCRVVPVGGQRFPELHVVVVPADVALLGGVPQRAAGAALLWALLTASPAL